MLRLLSLADVAPPPTQVLTGPTAAVFGALLLAAAAATVIWVMRKKSRTE